MLHRVRRPASVVLPAVLLVALVGCGSDDGSDEALDGFDAISVSGDFGAAPDVDWKGEMESDAVETEVLVEGDGTEIKDGDKVEVNVFIGNGFTQEKSYSTYDKGGTPETFTVNDQLSPVFKDALVGRTIGSRVAITTPSSELYGEQGNPQMDIGNEDPVLIIVDLMRMYQPPKPKDVPPAKLPGVIQEKGEPTGLDFKGLPEPKQDGDLLRAVLRTGKGKPVTTEMTLEVNYLGMVYNGKQPFDESYSKEPAEFALSGVVEGWTYGLEGLKVGSRVVLQIPPGLGYGAEEQPNIPANSTLYFVVDILSAK